jgi:hypothetical protein
MSAPGFLLADEANHHLVDYLVEAFNNIVQFQFSSKVHYKDKDLFNSSFDIII